MEALTWSAFESHLAEVLARQFLCVEPDAAQQAYFHELDVKRISGTAIAYEDALWPSVWAAESILLQQVRGLKMDLDGPRHFLLRRLSDLLSRCLLAEMAAVRELVDLQASELSARELYQQFVAQNCLDLANFAAFLTRYPVAKSSLLAVVSNWVDAVSELHCWLMQDRADLAMIGFSFNDECDLLVRMGLSDPHVGGRTVCLVSTRDGRCVVLKPHSADCEAVWFRCISSLNTLDSGLSQFIPLLLQKTDHAWVQYVPYQACRDASAIERYYERLGQQLALVYLLGVSDLHMENLIAHGEFPVFVDLEGLGTRDPDTPEIFHGTASELAQQQLAQSVLATGLLPLWRFGEPDQPGIDISAIGGSPDQTYPWSSLSYRNPNTWDMRVTETHFPVPAYNNLPRLPDMPVQPKHYVQPLIAGFRHMWEWIGTNAEQLRFQIREWIDCRPRVFYRSTNAYYHILNRISTPRSLNSPSEQSEMLDSLLTMDKDGLGGDATIHAAERLALLQRDIPRFNSMAHDRHLYLDSALLRQDYFKSRAIDDILNRLGTYDSANLELQIRLIRLAIDGRFGTPRGALHTTQNVNAVRGALIGSLAQPPDSQLEAMRSGASLIAEKLLGEAFSDQNGALGWIGLELIQRRAQWQLRPLGTSCYSGVAGLSHFMREHDLTRPPDAAGRLAGAACVLTIRQRLEQEAERTLARDGVGACSGVASAIFALLCNAHFLNERHSYNLACSLMERALRHAHSTDLPTGFFDGTSGLLAVLAFAHECFGWCPDWILSDALAERLLDECTRAHDTAIQPGLAHGRLGQAYGVWRYFNATKRAGTHEDRLLVDAFETVDKSHTSLCRGLTGLGLVLCDVLNQLPQEELLRAVVDQILQSEIPYHDHVCCGRAGIAYLLFRASAVLEDAALKNIGAALMLQAFGDRARSGTFSFMAAHGFETPGFMNGLAGVGFVACHGIANTRHVDPILIRIPSMMNPVR